MLNRNTKFKIFAALVDESPDSPQLKYSGGVTVTLLHKKNLRWHVANRINHKYST
jgi:hypothetical protein